MSRFRKIKTLVLASALSLGATLGAAPKAVPHAAVTPTGLGDFTLKGFNLNPQFLIDLYNTAEENGGSLSQLPTDWQHFNSVVQLSLTNNESSPDVPYIKITVSYQDCASVVSGGGGDILTTKSAVNPGPASLGAGSFTPYSNSFSGTQISSCFQNVIQNDLKNISDLQQAVHQLLYASFNVCLQLCTSNGTSYGAPVCQVFQIMAPPSANKYQAPVYVMPSKGAMICSQTPLFMWSAASGPAMSSSTIPYTLVVTQGQAGGNPVASISIPAGQTYYQWKAKDPVLNMSSTYFYQIVALNSVGQPLFGSNNTSGTPWSSFSIQCGNNKVTMQEVDTVTRKAISQNTSLTKIAGEMSTMSLQSLINPASLTDPIYQELVNGTASVTSVQVETH